MGWVFDDKSEVKKFVHGSQQISVVRVSNKKWKVEYFIDGKLHDSAGIMDEEFAKVMASEFCILRRFYPRP